MTSDCLMCRLCDPQMASAAQRFLVNPENMSRDRLDTWTAMVLYSGWFSIYRVPGPAGHLDSHGAILWLVLHPPCPWTGWGAIHGHLEDFLTQPSLLQHRLIYTLVVGTQSAMVLSRHTNLGFQLEVGAVLRSLPCSLLMPYSMTDLSTSAELCGGGPLPIV